MPTLYTVLVSSLGPLLLAADQTGLRRIAFATRGIAASPQADWIRYVETSGQKRTARHPEAVAEVPWSRVEPRATDRHSSTGDETLAAAQTLRAAAAQLRAYLAGDLRCFTLPLAPKGTSFQLQVWWALTRIPYGTTLTYGELARKVQRPGAARAVGAANARNPLPIVMPCHRVIGADGTLTGFAGGLEIKRTLLTLEGAVAKPTAAQLRFF